MEGARLARALQASLDAGGQLVPFAELSNDTAGVIQDGLAPDLERIGILDGAEQVPILLSRLQPRTNRDAEPAAAPGQPGMWRISAETITQLKERTRQWASRGPGIIC